MPPALQNPIALWFVLTAALAVACYFGLRPELRARGVLYGSFLIACLVAIWPPYDRDGQRGKIHLGLDLKGGIHLVLQVVTDEALTATIRDGQAAIFREDVAILESQQRNLTDRGRAAAQCAEEQGGQHDREET